VNNNNKRRRHNGEVGIKKQDSAASLNVAPTDKSEHLGVNAQSSEKFENGDGDNRALTTTETEHLAIRKKLFAQAGNAAFLQPPGESDWQILAAVLSGIGENDHLEAFLCSQMVVAHDLGMEFIRRARSPQQPAAGIDENLNRGIKLFRMFTRQVEVLRTLRSKGEQKMIVEHVHVHNGGQAIVGSVRQESKTTSSLDKHEG
jgi:hypothetical protein